MDSPSVGTTTSVAILFLFSARLAPRFGLAAMAQRLRDQGRLFGDVPLGKAGGGRSRRRAARISRPLRLHAGLAPAMLDERLDEGPVAVVLRLQHGRATCRERVFQYV